MVCSSCARAACLCPLAAGAARRSRRPAACFSAAGSLRDWRLLPPPLLRWAAGEEALALPPPLLRWPAGDAALLADACLEGGGLACRAAGDLPRGASRSPSRPGRGV